MQIGIDGNEANSSNRVGVGQYAFHILKQLSLLYPDNQFHIFLKFPPLADLPKPTPNWHYHLVKPSWLWTRFGLPKELLINYRRLDLFFSPSHYSPLFSPCPTIPTVHDLGYLKYPDQFTQKDFLQLKNWTKTAIKSATHIIAVSKFTKQTIIDTYHLPAAKITVAYNGVGDIPTDNSQLRQKTLTKFKLTKPFFLYLGTLKPNKNLPFLIQAFSRFLRKHPGHRLVIAGKKGWLFQDIFATVTSLQLSDQIHFTDYVTDNEKWHLLRSASAFVLPSIYEGFGIPALEAMAVGTPVVYSRIPSLEEVIGTAGLSFRLGDLLGLSQCLENIIKPAISRRYSLLGSARSQRYSWATSAKTIFSAFSSITPL